MVLIRLALRHWFTSMLAGPILALRASEIVFMFGEDHPASTTVTLATCHVCLADEHQEQPRTVDGPYRHSRFLQSLGLDKELTAE